MDVTKLIGAFRDDVSTRLKTVTLPAIAIKLEPENREGKTNCSTQDNIHYVVPFCLLLHAFYPPSPSSMILLPHCCSVRSTKHEAPIMQFSPVRCYFFPLTPKCPHLDTRTLSTYVPPWPGYTFWASANGRRTAYMTFPVTPNSDSVHCCLRNTGYVHVARTERQPTAEMKHHT
jgi:hypothetical protein